MAAPLYQCRQTCRGRHTSGVTLAHCCCHTGTLLVPTEVTRKVSELKSKAQEPRCTDVRFEDISLCPHHCTVAVSVTPADIVRLYLLKGLPEDYS